MSLSAVSALREARLSSWIKFRIEKARSDGTEFAGVEKTQTANLLSSRDIKKDSFQKFSAREKLVWEFPRVTSCHGRLRGEKGEN